MNLNKLRRKYWYNYDIIVILIKNNIIYMRWNNVHTCKSTFIEEQTEIKEKYKEG